jgi:predicted nucleic acid-binding protein
LKIVVDTNIVFSSLLNIDSNIAKILIQSNDTFSFYSCHFLREEINRHKKRILKITGYSGLEFDEAEYLILKNIQFINHNLIDTKILLKSKVLVEGVDGNDFPFVALAKHFKCRLWTGDKKLVNGLSKKDYHNCISTKELLEIISEK